MTARLLERCRRRLELLSALVPGLLLVVLSCAPGQLNGIGLDGSTVDLFGDGAVAAALIFVGTECPVSNRYVPTINQLAGEFADQGI